MWRNELNADVDKLSARVKRDRQQLVDNIQADSRVTGLVLAHSWIQRSTIREYLNKVFRIYVNPDLTDGAQLESLLLLVAEAEASMNLYCQRYPLSNDTQLELAAWAEAIELARGYIKQARTEGERNV